MNRPWTIGPWASWVAVRLSAMWLSHAPQNR